MSGRLLVEAVTLKIAVRDSAGPIRLTLVLGIESAHRSNGVSEPDRLPALSSSLASTAARNVLLRRRHLGMPWFFRR